MDPFNIDQWLSGEEGTRVVEAAARAVHDYLVHPNDPDVLILAACRDEARVALRAALSLTTREACSTCLGEDPMRTLDLLACPNPDCKGGTVPGEPALLSALVERVGRAVDATASGTVTIGDVHHYPAPGEMTYRLRPLREGDET